jgi:uncharacterized OsmC-like protein
MADDVVTDRVRSTTSGVVNRSLNQARTNHFVIDSSSGGPEAMTSIEAFLAGISSCGVNIVDREARERKVPLIRAQVDIESQRAKADTTVIASVAMRFELTGVTQAQAEELVAAYTRR